MRRAVNRTGSILQSAYNDIKELLSPPVCLACEGELPPNDSFFCEACIDELKIGNPGTGPVCPFCGTPDFSKTGCKCLQETKRLRLFYWGKYDGKLIEYIYTFKYQGVIELGNRLADEAMAVLFQRLNQNNYDFIIPVPLHKSRERKREYNQAEIIAKRISESINVRIAPGSVLRVKSTRPQSKIADERQRWANVRNAFSLSEDNAIEFEGKRVLIVDDIVTTGATIYEASKPLLLANAALVDIFSLAYAGYSKSR